MSEAGEWKHDHCCARNASGCMSCTKIATLRASVAELEAVLLEVLDQEEYQLGKATLATISTALGVPDEK